METVEDQAQTLFRQGKFDQAIEKYDSLINTNPTSLNYYNRACCLINLEKYKDSIEDFTKAINLLKDTEDENLYNIIFRRAQTFEKIDNIGKCSDDLNRVIKFSKNLEMRNNAQEILTKIKTDKLRDYDETALEREREGFLKIFRENMEIHLGSEWHIVSNNWFQNWQGYVGLKSLQQNEDLPFNLNIDGKVSHPGIIDNSDIIELDLSKNGTDGDIIYLKGELVENVNYILLPKVAFEYLENIYKCYNDITRYAIEVNDSIYQVEVSLKRIKVSYPTLNSLETATISISRKETLGNLKKQFMSSKGYLHQSRIWKVNLGVISLARLQAITISNRKIYVDGGVILKEDLQLDDAEIGDEDIILIEPVRNSVFLFSDDINLSVDCCDFCQQTCPLHKCKYCKKVKYCSVQCKRDHLDEHKLKCNQPKKSLSIFRCFCRQSAKLDNIDEDEVKISPSKLMTQRTLKNSATGLQNLGNSCFMNSALQCLSYTEELSSYFLTNEYQKDINKLNPLGTKGKLAVDFAELLENL